MEKPPELITPSLTPPYEWTPAAKVGVVFDIPHSGTLYPPDFGYACPFADLQTVEDTAVDRLYAPAALRNGAGLMKANFPRSFVDVNRESHDMERVAFAKTTHEWVPSAKALSGHGVFHTYIKGKTPIYDHALDETALLGRLDAYYHPYHLALAELLAETHRQYGKVVLIDCHAMSPSALVPNFPQQQPDFVLGDRDGTTCDITIRKQIQKTLTDMGYRVAVNNPYKGATILMRHTDPARGFHGVQIEINKALYMDKFNQIIDSKYSALIENIDRLVSVITVQI